MYAFCRLSVRNLRSKRLALSLMAGLRQPPIMDCVASLKCLYWRFSTVSPYRRTRFRMRIFIMKNIGIIFFLFA